MALNAASADRPARLVSDAVASLTALHANPGLPPSGVVALLDFGGSGTSITLADAASGFEPIDETTRYVEFSGDQIDQALLSHVVDGIATAAVSIRRTPPPSDRSPGYARNAVMPRSGSRRRRSPSSRSNCPDTGPGFG